MSTWQEGQGGYKVPTSARQPLKRKMMTFWLVRHGMTKMNNVKDESADRIRGWLDVPLTDGGEEEASRIGEQLADQDIRRIYTSPLRRAVMTAKLIGEKVGIKVVTNECLYPWNVGILTGKPSKEAVPQLIRYASATPDEPIPDGESFNHFKKRAFRFLLLLEHEGTVLVTHHRLERLIKAWVSAGCPKDHSIDMDVFRQKGENPGKAEKITVAVNQ
jgi:broad specificity phosphatase PhoE